jgi:hypothetical protein
VQLARLQQLRLHGLEAAARRLRVLRRVDLAVGAAMLAIRIEPLRESAHRTLADLHLDDGECQAAIAAGVDPAAVVDPIDRARADRDAARACLTHPEQQPELYTEKQVSAMVDELGDVGAVIRRARP